MYIHSSLIFFSVGYFLIPFFYQEISNVLFCHKKHINVERWKNVRITVPKKSLKYVCDVSCYLKSYNWSGGNTQTSNFMTNNINSCAITFRLTSSWSAATWHQPSASFQKMTSFKTDRLIFIIYNFKI